MKHPKDKIIKVMIVAGARPNFVKIAPLFCEFKRHPEIKPILVHTGQHYDFEMSQVFFQDLDIPKPDYDLGVAAGTHGAQTGQTMIKLEEVVQKTNPDIVVVVGDVNSTVAAALVASKLHIPVAHIEAGLRSFDKTMPEEINRVLTDHISDILFCPTKTAVINLKKEGIIKGVYNTGDIMFDILRMKAGNRISETLNELGIKPKDYFLLTIHRAANTDNEKNLKRIVDAIVEMKENIIFPVHPRTKAKLENFGLAKIILGKDNIKIIQPVGYLEMLSLEKNAKKILTDSGGVQKEAFWFGVPCITLREETEWTETLNGGWNILAGTNKTKIRNAVLQPVKSRKRGDYYGNGHAAKKIVAGLIRKIK